MKCPFCGRENFVDLNEVHLHFWRHQIEALQEIAKGLVKETKQE